MDEGSIRRTCAAYGVSTFAGHALDWDLVAKMLACVDRTYSQIQDGPPRAAKGLMKNSLQLVLETLGEKKLRTVPLDVPALCKVLSNMWRCYTGQGHRLADTRATNELALDAKIRAENINLVALGLQINSKKLNKQRLDCLADHLTGDEFVERARADRVFLAAAINARRIDGEVVRVPPRRRERSGSEDSRRSAVSVGSAVSI
jgi:hypothetical protein